MLQKKSKLLYCTPHIWKKIYLFHKSFVFKTSEKLFFTRSSIIPKIYNGSNISIYAGKTWHERHVTQWMTGFKFGEFTWNRKIALYKAKQLKKKKKKSN